MEPLYCLVTIFHQIYITMEQLESIIMDGVTFVMMFIIAQLKLMSFVISWDTPDIQATLELVVSGTFFYLWLYSQSLLFLHVVMVQTIFL